MLQCCGRNQKIEIAYSLSEFSQGPTQLTESLANFLVELQNNKARKKLLQRQLTAQA